ncbi:hypothetical protein [Streptomyces virginiae]|uniref:hypothetical protein n=1 Tax=Streptomyces virginiae TaxID=1961 RepID=UPI00368C3625
MSDSTLPPPLVQEATDDNVLNSLDALNGINITIPPYSGMNPGDTVQLCLGGEGTVARTFEVTGETADREISLMIPWSIIERESGGQLAVSYTITRSAGAEVESAPLDLTIEG